MKEENDSESTTDTESESDFDRGKKRSGRFHHSNNIDIIAKLVLEMPFCQKMTWNWKKAKIFIFSIIFVGKLHLM